MKVLEGRLTSVIEVNCETDFVAKNDEFNSLAKLERLASSLPTR